MVQQVPTGSLVLTPRRYHRTFMRLKFTRPFSQAKTLSHTGELLNPAVIHTALVKLGGSQDKTET